MEKASLQRLTLVEELPSEKVWHQLCEAGDRKLLQHTLEASEEKPPTRIWSGIENKFNRRKRVRAATIWMISTAAVLLLVSKNIYLPPAPFPSKNIAQAATFSPSIPVPSVTEDPITTTTAPSGTNAIMPATKKEATVTFEKLSQGEPRSAYLWVAAKNGEPMRLSKRWEKLSCCLSGEQASMPCDEQRTQWHAELMETELGFQADPLFGLMALLRTSAGTAND